MSRSLLLRLLTLLSCSRVLSGSFAEKEYSDMEVAVGKHNSEMDVIQCRMCHLMFPGEKCSRGRGVCTATNEEACAIGMMYKADHTLWLTFMGCVKNCANVRNIKWSVYFVTFKCCRGYDLCNEDL